MKPIRSALWIALAVAFTAAGAANAQQSHPHDHSAHASSPPSTEAVDSHAERHTSTESTHEAETGRHQTQHQHDVDHSRMDHHQHDVDHSRMDHRPGNVDHSQMQRHPDDLDHAHMDLGDHEDQADGHAHADHSHAAGPMDLNHDLRDPIPPVTDADRAAAFPDLRHHHQHGDSRHSFWLLDQLETSDASGGTDISWEGSAWMGSDLNRLWLRTKGHALDGDVETGRLEVLYGRPIRPWWDLVAGVRQDFGDGPSRTWAAFGVQGMAPYFFEIEATGYVGESGRTALNLEAEYEMLLTNRLILTWEAEATAFGKSDPEQLVGSGLSTIEAGLRLRYEFSRRFAPYIGFEREWSYGRTSDLRALAGHDSGDSKWVVGVRLWF